MRISLWQQFSSNHSALLLLQLELLRSSSGFIIESSIGNTHNEGAQ